jgi:hypothetical protein
MPKADPELLRFLSQRTFRSLHELHDLRYRRSCLRMLLQQLDVSCGEWLACWSLLFRFGHFVFPQMGADYIARAVRSASEWRNDCPFRLEARTIMPQLRHQIARRLNDAICSGPGAMRIGEMAMRDESNLTLMLIVGIAALLSLGTILVRSVGPIEKQFTTELAIAELRGSLR